MNVQDAIVIGKKRTKNHISVRIDHKENYNYLARFIIFIPRTTPADNTKNAVAKIQ